MNRLPNVAAMPGVEATVANNADTVAAVADIQANIFNAERQQFMFHNGQNPGNDLALFDADLLGSGQTQLYLVTIPNFQAENVFVYPLPVSEVSSI
jgi:hypothetical protein